MQISFKGYDAAPLKRVFIEKATSDPINEEMKAIAKEEGYKLRYATDYLKWAQDDKTIIERNNKPHLIGNFRPDEDFMRDMEQNYDIKSTYAKTFVTGGNSFIGKYTNGEKWLLIGEDEIHGDKTKTAISEEYGIDEKNIHTIPQQYYHLDMFMRPVCYPYVLVDNPKLANKTIEKMNWIKYPYDYIHIRNNFNEFEESRSEHYSSAKRTIEALKGAGFIPIEIAGVFGSGINFLNAIVNKHKDGSISYITNSTKCGSPLISELEKAFEEDLREKVDNIDKVYFVRGSAEEPSELSNYMMRNLLKYGGGIHCMSLEEPNFEIWA